MIQLTTITLQNLQAQEASSENHEVNEQLFSS